MTAPHIPDTIWIVVTDLGPHGIASADFVSSLVDAADKYQDSGPDMSRVIEVCLAEGTSRDVTDECEVIASGWREAAE